MPNLYPGILPLFRSGTRLLCLCAVLFFPRFLFAQPTISSVSPLTGPVGTTVTITGNNFSTTPSANIVRFGTATGTVTAATATSLTVTTPPGASYAPITVTTGGLTAYSYTPFSTTFNDPGQFTATAFSSATNIPAGSGPSGIVAMDFDGDGLADLAVANNFDATIGVYLNASTSGSPSFTQQVLLNPPSSSYPQFLAAGDLDGDGKPDLVMADNNGGGLVVFQNTSSIGHISFAQLPALSESGYGDTWVTIGDLNGDGKPDVALVESSSNTIEIYPNTSSVGSISFGTAIPLFVPNHDNPYALGIADLDGDGMPDLAISEGGPGLLSVFRNKSTIGGTISFAARVDYTIGTNPQGLAIGDLDGDGHPDIVVTNNTDNTFSILRNISSPGSPAFNITTVATGAGPFAVSIADLDGDGHPDIAGASNGEDAVSVHRNTSTPGTITLAANVDYTTDYGPVALAVADLDGNGTPDMSTANIGYNNDFSVFLNQSPTAPAITAFTPTTGGTGTQITITGVNFTGATVVSFGGVAATSFNVVNATTITALVATGASGSVLVTTPNGTASRAGFTFGAAAPPPALTSFSPAAGTYGTVDTIRGTGLTQVNTVTFGTQSALSFTILNDTTITAVVGEGASGNITVNPGSSTSATIPGFMYLQPASITVTGFTPAAGTTGTGVTITGSGFLNTPYVTFGGTPASNVHVVNDSVITATVTSGTSGYVAVHAFNGNDSVSGFTYIAAAPPQPPMLNSFTPQSGATGAKITIAGQHFSSVTSVSFGDVPASSFQIVSDSVIVAIVGNGASGEVTIANANTNTADSLPNFLFLYDSTKTSPSGTFQLVTFTATLTSNQPFLQWTTVNDAGISYYVVERGVDGNNFTTIGTVKSQAAAGLGATYNYIDSFPKPGVNYYRIKAQDTTAAYSYSTIQAVQLLSMTMPVYPNPVKYGFFLVDLPSITKPSIFRLSNTWGMVVQTISVPAGVAQFRINVPGLLPGTYRLYWSDGDKIAYQTILVLYK